MWIVRIALNRPYTFFVLALLLFIAGPLAMLRTPIDILPAINIPVVRIIWTYIGLVPAEMETRVTSIYERALTTTVGNHGGTIFVKDVAHVRDGFAVQTKIVRQDGQRGVLLTIEKAGDASTLAIVSDIRAALPEVSATLPSALKIRPLSDQSVFVRSALSGVVREVVIAAALTSIMILLFLGSWRSTLIICISIPLSIMTSLFLLSMLGETVNIMTLGGLALPSVCSSMTPRSRLKTCNVT